MTTTFVKRDSGPAIEWEARGLSWLRAARGALVVPVVEWGDGHLTEERLTPVPVTAPVAEDFGRRLWATHAAGADAFGTGPDEWDDATPGWIGHARLPLGHYARWGEFYAELRLLPHAKAAHDQGSLSPTDLAAVERVCERLVDGDFDDGRPPARIHGDLWAGNVIFTTRGGVVIDPAAHGGHGETDLAMLALFGVPMLSRVQAAYAEAAGLDAGWPSRILLHQLHPLLVHAQLFGSGYGYQAGEAARRYV
ncbi:fructosamine kinase family protein [Brooklawnia cerclae]|uniref:Fructosamine-3-kinase n=1 Tax=Brooklawnia cerclae TaxID=349934 RepID=A0ABX0SEE9_9ACTN|nr:fructosamine kinase family protein [Brooklawnia cerclae]NIH56762.1 fructosamine-3-kinase [Brooklawnia cerclae]